MCCGFDLGFYLDFLHAGSEQPILPFFYFRAGSVSVPLGILGNGRYGVIVGLLYVAQGAVVTAGFSSSAFTENGYDLKLIGSFFVKTQSWTYSEDFLQIA